MNSAGARCEAESQR
jgi:hypothetical protein